MSIFTKFQFHYGSIKIGKLDGIQKLNFVFQFHYGSIKIYRT